MILAVAHREFIALGAAGIRALLRQDGVLFDVQRVLDRSLVDARL